MPPPQPLPLLVPLLVPLLLLLLLPLPLLPLLQPLLQPLLLVLPLLLLMHLFLLPMLLLQLLLLLPLLLLLLLLPLLVLLLQLAYLLTEHPLFQLRTVEPQGERHLPVIRFSRQGMICRERGERDVGDSKMVKCVYFIFSKASVKFSHSYTILLTDVPPFFLKEILQS